MSFCPERGCVASTTVQLDEDLFIRHVVRRFLRRVPPERPPQDLRDGRADVDGDVAQDAVLTRLPEFDSLRGFADSFLAFKQTGTEDGEKSFIAVHHFTDQIFAWLIASPDCEGKLVSCLFDRSSSCVMEFICLNLISGSMHMIGVARESGCLSATHIPITRHLTVKSS